MSPSAKRLYRGMYLLPHQSQVLQRDLDAEKIAANLGARASGWRRSTEQLAALKADSPNRTPYEFMVHSPNSASTAWTAFSSLSQLNTWCRAYDLHLQPQNPVPGSRFEVRLPDSTIGFAPLGSDEDDYQAP